MVKKCSFVKLVKPNKIFNTTGTRANATWAKDLFLIRVTQTNLDFCTILVQVFMYQLNISYTEEKQN